MSAATPEPIQPSQSITPHPALQQQASTVSPGFAAMLGPTATPDEVQKAMNQAVNFIILQLKEEEKKAKEASQHMKDVIEGKDDN